MHSDDNAAADALDQLEAAAVRLALRAEWEQGNRRGLLWVHALLGIAAGTAICLYGAAPNIEALGVWTRSVLGFAGLSGGLLLAAGLILRRTRPLHSPWLTLEVCGLGIMGLWDGSICLALLAARVQDIDQNGWGIRMLTEPLPPAGTYVLPYPIAVYFALFALICIHLWTLRRMRAQGMKPS